MSSGARLVPLVSGLLFGAGLTISGMTDPQRVRGFLDVFGHWDPTLLFVMAGAIAVMAITWQIQSRMAQPIFAGKFSLPGCRDVDSKLIAGSTIFGVGWGIAGLCPGPAIASLALAPGAAVTFLAAMFAGMAMHAAFAKRPGSHPKFQMQSKG